MAIYLACQELLVLVSAPYVHRSISLLYLWSPVTPTLSWDLCTHVQQRATQQTPQFCIT